MVIRLETYINAPIELVFRLGRSLDVHKAVNTDNEETILKGRSVGLVEQGDIITWQAKHFGIRQQLQVIVYELEAPLVFKDQMLSGPFKTMHHIHQFEKNGENGTKMIDVFTFSSPLGLLGSLFDRLILSKYLTRFLQRKNSFLKQIAESNTWQPYLKHSS